MSAESPAPEPAAPEAEQQPRTAPTDTPYESPPEPPKTRAAPDAPKTKRFTDSLWTMDMKILTLKECIGNGYFSNVAKAKTLEKILVNLNSSSVFAKLAVDLSEHALKTFLKTAMRERRIARAKDERATGAGDQAFNDYIKLLDDAIQLEDDAELATGEKKEENAKKQAKKEKMQSRGEEMRSKAFGASGKPRPKPDEGDSEGPKKRFKAQDFAREQAEMSAAARRDRAADQVAKRGLERRRIEQSEKQMELEKQAAADAREAAAADREERKVAADRNHAAQQEMMAMMQSTVGNVTSLVSSLAPLLASLANNN